MAGLGQVVAKPAGAAMVTVTTTSHLRPLPPLLHFVGGRLITLIALYYSHQHVSLSELHSDLPRSAGLL